MYARLGGLCRRTASDNAAVSRSCPLRNISGGWDLRCLEASKALRVMPPRARQIKRPTWKSGLASRTGCGLCRPNNAASRTEVRLRKCFTWQQLSSRIAIVSIACYAAGVAIVTNYDGAFPAAELHSSLGQKIAPGDGCSVGCMLVLVVLAGRSIFRFDRSLRSMGLVEI